MDNNFNQIKTIFDEIEFYENHGFHKIADELVHKVVTSWTFNADAYNDVYTKNWLQLTGPLRAIMNEMLQHPECAGLMQLTSQYNTQEFPNYQDCRLKIQQQYQLKHPGVALSQDELDEIENKCLDAGSFDIDSPAFVDAGASACYEALSEPSKQLFEQVYPGAKSKFSQTKTVQ